MAEFKDKFIAYLDVLGFRKLVEASEAGTGMPLDGLLSLLRSLGTPEERGVLEKYGPSICPQSTYSERNLDFRLTQISDCVIVSSEISPAGAINLIHHCWGIVLKLLQKGFMCRGYITRGGIFQTDTQFIGTGYIKAYDNESKVTAFKREADERGTPFVEIDQVVCSYIDQCDDRCVKDMFRRLTRDSGEVVALFPFQRLSHSFVIGGFNKEFCPEKEKQSNQVVRQMLADLIERVMTYVDISNPRAVRKAEHYRCALDAQLEVCDKTDKMIGLFSPFPTRQL